VTWSGLAIGAGGVDNGARFCDSNGSGYSAEPGPPVPADARRECAEASATPGHAMLAPAGAGDAPLV